MTLLSCGGFSLRGKKKKKEVLLMFGLGFAHGYYSLVFEEFLSCFLMLVCFMYFSLLLCFLFDKAVSIQLGLPTH